MLRNVATTYLARFATVLSTFLLVPIVAPAVGLEPYGLYALVSAMGVLFAQDLGMASATIRFTAEAFAVGDSRAVRHVASASSWYFIATGVVLSGATTVGFALILPTVAIPDETNVILLVALGVANVFFGLALSSHRQLLAGVGRLDVANLVQIAQALVRILMTIVVVIVSADIVLIALVDLLATVAGGLACWALRRILAPSTVFHARDFRWIELKRLFKFSLDLLVMMLAAVVILQSGTVLAAMLLPLGAVAVYTAANRAFLLVREAANSLTLALLPTASMQAATGEKAANSELVLNGTRIANAAMILLLVPVLAFADTLLTWWVGPELAAGYVAAQVLVVSLLANNNHLVAVPVLIGIGRIRGYAILHAIWAITGIALAPLLAPQLGVVGIAIALSIPVVILEPIYILIALRALNISGREFVLRAIIRPYVALAAPAAALVAVGAATDGSLGWTLGCFAAWLVTGVALAWWLILSAGERKFLTEKLRRRPSRGDGAASPN